MSSPEKERAKIEKKKAKAELKKLKKTSGKTLRKTETKDWRKNIWLYITVAILIGLIVWGLTAMLSKILPF